MKAMNIFMIGVGGQGIGFLSELLLRSTAAAGYEVFSVDTHGLAQRGGTVTSHLRIRPQTPHSVEISALTRPHQADLCISLERHEALRAIETAVKPGGTLIYYDTSLQPVSIRMGNTPLITQETVSNAALNKNIRIYRVQAQLQDSRMQNTAVSAEIIRHKLIEGLSLKHIEAALNDLQIPARAEKNLTLLNQLLE